MYLEVTARDLKKKSVFEFIASSIEAKFQDSKEDVEKIRNASTNDEVASVFGEYYEGWKFDGVNFLYGDIDTIVMWMDQDVQLYKKQLEHKKWVEWLAERGLNPEKVRKQQNKKSS